jgi:hypothetical protein
MIARDWVSDLLDPSAGSVNSSSGICSMGFFSAYSAGMRSVVLPTSCTGRWKGTSDAVIVIVIVIVTGGGIRRAQGRKGRGKPKVRRKREI